VRVGDDGAEGVERGTAKEDIIRCGCVNDEEADRNSFSLGFVTKDDVKINVVAGVGVSDMLPSRGCNRAALVDKDFLDCVVFDFNSDDHGVVLLVIEVVEVVVRKGDGRHAASVMGMGNMVDGLDMAEVFLSGRRRGSSTSETTRDGVDSAA